MKKFFTALLVCCFLCGFYYESYANELVKVPTCWMDESPAFNAWYAKKLGLDHEEGLDIEMLLFNSGPAQMEALPAKQWVMGSTGIGGQLIGGIRYNIYAIAPLNSEGEVNAFYVRPDSPLLKQKGFNPNYPNVYGTPDQLRGKNILLTSQTTVHYIIGNWLEILGLQEKDVKLTNMEQASIIAAFEKGIGDVAALWAPFTFAAEAKGWKKIGSTDSTKAYTASMIVGDKKWCDEHPDIAAKFLRVMYRVSDIIRKEGSSPKIIAAYQEFMSDFCGLKMTREDAVRDLEIHPRWTMDEALKIASSASGTSEMNEWMNQAADFFGKIGRFTPAEVQSFKAKNIGTDRFLKMAAEKPLSR